MDLLTGLIIFFGGAILFLIFALVVTFVVLGALKMRKNVDAKTKVDVSDGIDPQELELIKEALRKTAAQDAEAEAKAKLVATAAKIAEAAKS